MFNQIESMKIRNTLIIAAVSLIGLFCSLVIFAIINRIPHWSAETVTLSSVNVGVTVIKKEEALIKFNRGGTGKAYLYKDGSWTLITEANAIKPVKMDILGVASKIDGRSVFEDDGLKTFIYNGTSWRLTGEMIEVNVKCSDEKNNFKRIYYQKTDIAPFSDGTFTFNITKPMDFKSYSVNLVDWYGVPELADEKSN